MKVKIEISICTGLMLNHHSNPYIESTTVLSDIFADMYTACAANYFKLGTGLASSNIINPRRACAARITVVVLCVCLSVCLFVCLRLFSHYRLRGGL